MPFSDNNKYRRLCFTANIPQDKDFTDFPLETLRIRLNPGYMVAQEEIASTGQKHYQGYFELEKQRTGKTIRNCFKDWGISAHLELSLGSEEQNTTYCTKEESRNPGSTPFRFGTPCVKQGQRTDLSEMVSRIKEGASDQQLLEEHPANFIKHHKAFALVRQLVAPKRTEPSKLIFLWGPTGNGKTTAAMSSTEPPPECVDWEGGRFLQGYTGSNEAVLFDDFDWASMGVKYFLRLVDRWPMTVSTKGSFVNFGPKTILFTSNDDPKDWWPEAPPATREAVHRRMAEFGEIIYLESKLPVARAQHLLDSYFKKQPSVETVTTEEVVWVEGPADKWDSDEDDAHSQPSLHEAEQRASKRHKGKEKA